MSSSNQILKDNNTNLFISVLIVGTAAFWAGTVFEKNNKRRTSSRTVSISSITSPSYSMSLPKFAKDLEINKHLHRVRLREWEDLEWRKLNGWTGRDLCHNPHGSAVRVLSYYHNSTTNQMIGVVWFGPDAESHRGLW